MENLKNNKDRIEQEKSFHDKRFGEKDIREKLNKYYSVNTHVWNRYTEIISEHCKGKKLLELGCGTAINAEKWIDLGAILTGIDISSEGIKKAKEKISNKNLKADFFVMNAEKTDFPDNTFDIVIGTGIIHHLDLISAYEEIHRILKINGHAIFLEPLGHNIFINLYRRLTPQMRTKDEHPLIMKDIKLLKQYFKKVEVEYFTLFTLLAVPFRKSPIFKKLLATLKAIDDTIFSLLPFMGRYAWMAIIHAQYPKK